MRTLITGATGALGSELAVEFSRTGEVVLQGRDTPHSQMHKLVERCGRKNTSVILGDLEKLSTHHSIYEYAVGYDLDCAIFCAADHQRGPFRHTSYQAQRSILGLNLQSAMDLTRLLLPAFSGTKNSTLVYINSTAGTETSPEEAIYSASKHGLDGFVKALRLELRPAGIRVLQVFLGAMKGKWMRNRPDHDYLIDPKEVAAVIHNVVTGAPTFLRSLQIEDITFGRFNFPPSVV